VREGEGKGDEEEARRAITVQFVQLTFIMSPSGGVDRASEQSRGAHKTRNLTPIIQSQP